MLLGHLVPTELLNTGSGHSDCELRYLVYFFMVYIVAHEVFGTFS